MVGRAERRPLQRDAVPCSGSLASAGSGTRYSSGHRSWWSKTNLVPSSRRSSIAIGQKMSGGLHACTHLELAGLAGPQHQPQRRQERVGVLATNPSLLPPGA